MKNQKLHIGLDAGQNPSFYLQPPIPEEYHGLKPTCAMKMTVSADERVRRLRDFSSSLFVLTAHSLLALWIPVLPFLSFSFLHCSSLAPLSIQLGKWLCSANKQSDPGSWLFPSMFISIRLPISREWCLLTKYYQRWSKIIPTYKTTSYHFSFSCILISPPPCAPTNNTVAI